MMPIAATQKRIRNGTRARLHRYWEMFADLFPARPYLGGSAIGALDIHAAVVSKWAGSRQHLQKARPMFYETLLRVEAHVRLDPALFTPRADYLLRVRGQSMRDAGILDGDFLAVHRSSDARSGQIVVARLAGRGGDEVTVKRLKRRGGQLLLVAENPDFAPIIVDPKEAALAIEGIAVGLVRNGKSW